MAGGPTIIPIGGRRRLHPIAQPIGEYPVLKNVSAVAGQPVDQKRKVVKLTAAQARYWQDQGVIGKRNT